jgi:tetratricopeptide (TPR) repeat protein
MIGDLWRFWQMRGHLDEASDRIEEVLALDGDDPSARLAALEAAGGIAYWRGQRTHGPYYREAVELARRTGEPAELANALYNCSFPTAQHDIDAGLALLEEARAIYEGLGDRIGLARVHWGMGDVLSYRQEFDLAMDHFRASAEGFEGTDRPYDRGYALFALGFTQLQDHRPEGAEEPMRESFPIFRDAQDMSAIVLHLAAFGAAAHGVGDFDRAYRLAGAMTALRDRIGLGLVDVEENAFEPLTQEELSRLEGADAAAFAEGLDMSTEDAIAYAMREIDIRAQSR